MKSAEPAMASPGMAILEPEVLAIGPSSSSPSPSTSMSWCLDVLGLFEAYASTAECIGCARDTLNIVPVDSDKGEAGSAST